MKDGGPAFPVSTRPCNSGSGYGHQDGKSTWQFGGMSLRDWFAGQAIGDILNDYPFDRPVKNAAELAYKVADAMLKAREQEGT